jgi:hypothetical protein
MLKQYAAWTRKADTDGHDTGDVDHVVSQIADLLAEASQGKTTRAEAINWLMSSRGGRALLTHLAQFKRATDKRTTAMDNTAPVVKIAEALAETGTSFMSESELTQKIFEYAQFERRANESPHQAFARTFTANTAEAELFRKAVAVCKSADLRPVGSDDAAAERAYAKLEKLAEQYRARHPGLSQEQSFAKVFTDPANKALAEQAHQRPVAMWR